MGITQTLSRNCINGFKKLLKEREQKIKEREQKMTPKGTTGDFPSPVVLCYDAIENMIRYLNGIRT